MTESIIIDGVDVAGCEYFSPTCVSTHLWDKCGNLTKSNKCENNPNCYYKQLKRLEQENKELKETLNAFVKHSRTESDKVYYKMLDYKTALEEIKKVIDCANSEYKSDDDCKPQQCSKIENKINEVLNDK